MCNEESYNYECYIKSDKYEPISDYDLEEIKDLRDKGIKSFKMPNKKQPIYNYKRPRIQRVQMRGK